MPVPKRPPAFQFYPDAWFGSVAVEMMPPEVEGTYIRLLARQWLAVTLTPDPSMMRRLTKLDEKSWRSAWPLLEPHFPLTADGKARQNPTLHALHIEREEYLARQKTNGSVGGRPPKNPTVTKTKSQRKPSGLPNETQGFRKHEPSINPNETSVSGSVSELPPTAADAAVGPPAAAASDLPPNFAQRTAELRARFLDERSVVAFDRHLRGSRNPEGFLLDLEYAAKVRPSDGAEGVPWDVIGLALHELSAKGRPATEHLIRVFAMQILTPATSPVASMINDSETEADVLRRIHAGEFLRG